MREPHRGEHVSMIPMLAGNENIPLMLADVLLFSISESSALQNAPIQRKSSPERHVVKRRAPTCPSPFAARYPRSHGIAAFTRPPSWERYDHRPKNTPNPAHIGSVVSFWHARFAPLLTPLRYRPPHLLFIYLSRPALLIYLPRRQYIQHGRWAHMIIQATNPKMR